MAYKLQLGLTGYPLDHSLSPRIHMAALDACGLKGEYSLFPIAPDDRQGLKELLARVRDSEIHGLNVTIPHKENVIPLLDALTPTAQAIGAVNTIFMRNGNLTGDNTDVPGFLTDLKCFLRKPGITSHQVPITNRQSSIVNHKLALVLGAGGSARAVTYALVNDGWDVVIASRRLEQAQILIPQFAKSESRLSAIELQRTNLQSLISHLSLLVNTTPLGMSPNVESSPWPANLSFPPNAAVYDLVYNPRQTKLVKHARAAGLPAITGLGMLIEQAALAFELWTGCKPPRNVLWKSVDQRR